MTTWTPRENITSTWIPRTGPQTDLGYFITQLGILCDNNGNRILFHVGTLYDNDSIWTPRTIPN